MTYKREAIIAALQIINSIDISGVENMKRLVMLDQILRNPEKEEDNGTERCNKDSEEE